MVCHRLISTHARWRDTPLNGAWRAPNIPDSYLRSSIEMEQFVVVPKAHVRAHLARGPVFDEGTRACPEPWPTLLSLRMSVQSRQYCSRGRKKQSYLV